MNLVTKTKTYPCVIFFTGMHNVVLKLYLL